MSSLYGSIKRIYLSYQSKLIGWDLSGKAAVNHLALIMIVIATGFTLILLITGVDKWFYVWSALPLYLSVLWANKKQKFKLASTLLLLGSLLLISFWSFTNRRVAAEMGYLALACSLPVLVQSVRSMVWWFLVCLTLFLLYRYYDATTPFVPDPSINYIILSNSIIVTSICIVFIQIISFRELAFHFSTTLKNKNTQLDKVIEGKEKMEKELQAKNEEMQTLTEQLNWIVIQKNSELQVYLDAINVNIYSAISDNNGRFVKVNDPLLNASGYRSEELIGNHFSILDSGFHSPLFLSRLESTVKSGNPWRGEFKSRGKDGSYFWCDQVIIPIGGKTDTINYFLTLGLPITERKQTEETRDKTLSLLETIAFQTSHKVRGPLARIEGLVNLIQHDLVSMAELKMVSAKLKDSSIEVNLATSDLVNFVNDHQISIQ
ncbi:MAG: PAS domain S-box protein [Cyclobacteriaceae bacterium]|nr:PAS domain S-box protein [Cyclobacteriaceae bacterium]